MKKVVCVITIINLIAQITACVSSLAYPEGAVYPFVWTVISGAMFFYLLFLSHIVSILAICMVIYHWFRTKTLQTVDFVLILSNIQNLFAWVQLYAMQ